jgi:hypothetical protein
LRSGARDFRPPTDYFPRHALTSVLYERDFFAWNRQQAGSLASTETRWGKRPVAEPARSRQEDRDMTLEFTVGINIAGDRQSVTVSAEDALIAALKVKHETPQAMINYVRRRNRRGDRRHPHKSITAA